MASNSYNELGMLACNASNNAMAWCISRGKLDDLEAVYGRVLGMLSVKSGCPSNTPQSPVRASEGNSGKVEVTPTEALLQRFRDCFSALGQERFYEILTRDFSFLSPQEAIDDGQADVVLRVMETEKKGGG